MILQSIIILVLQLEPLATASPHAAVAEQRACWGYLTPAPFLGGHQ